MSNYISNNVRKVTTQHLQKMKQEGEKISMLTAYDYSMARLIDGAGIDVILVGDSASNTMAGNKTTLPMTLDQIIYHGQSVINAVTRAHVAIDMPFGTCSGDVNQSLANAVRIIKETGADAVKIEGGEEIIEDIRKINNAGIPVMGHLGLMPQSVNKYGGYGLRANNDEEADKLIKDAKLLQEAGCYSLVLEKIPATLASKVAKEITIPVIGIGAGADVDGQVLVIHDLLGMDNSFSTKFMRRYADLQTVITDAVKSYITDVKSVDFPNETESY